MPLNCNNNTEYIIFLEYILVLVMHCTMRQVITLGAHIMNQNDQFIIFGSIINKQKKK